MFGRGRGRGRFGGGFRVGSEKPFECFPGIELPDQKKVVLDKAFARYNFKLQAYWENSAYFVGEGASEKRCQNEDIERFSDSKKPRYQTKQQSFSDYMKLAPGYFPLELVQGVKVSRAPKKVKWSASTDSKKLDFLEKLDNKSEGKKDDEDEGGEEEEEQEDEEYSDDGDYEQTSLATRGLKATPCKAAGSVSIFGVRACLLGGNITLRLSGEETRFSLALHILHRSELLEGLQVTSNTGASKCNLFFLPALFISLRWSSWPRTFSFFFSVFYGRIFKGLFPFCTCGVTS